MSDSATNRPIAGPENTSKILRLGVFGNEGSFTEEACLAWAESEGMGLGVDFELRHLVDPRGLLVALEACRIERALLPLHNSQAGLVLGSLAALSGHRFELLGQTSLLVRQCLCLKSSAIDPARVRAIVSHPQALAQCEATLQDRFPSTERIPWSDTASAARDLAVGVLPAQTTAILCSKRAADRFDLLVLDCDAQDAKENRTSFCVLGRSK